MALLKDTAIQLTEVSNELRHYGGPVSILYSGRLHELEQRLFRQISLARKHHMQLLQEQAGGILLQYDASAGALAEAAEHQYQSAPRVKHADSLAGHITTAYMSLIYRTVSWPLTCTFQPEKLNADGGNRMEFMVMTNPWVRRYNRLQK